MSNKIGVKIKIAVDKIDKARLFRGSKGIYLDATVFIDPDNPGQFGDHGMITQDVKKEERDAGVKGAILGNVEVFWREGGQQAASGQGHSNHGQAPQQKPADALDDLEDLPF